MLGQLCEQVVPAPCNMLDGTDNNKHANDAHQPRISLHLVWYLGFTRVEIAPRRATPRATQLNEIEHVRLPVLAHALQELFQRQFALPRTRVSSLSLASFGVARSPTCACVMTSRKLAPCTPWRAGERDQSRCAGSAARADQVGFPNVAQRQLGQHPLNGSTLSGAGERAWLPMRRT